MQEQGRHFWQGHISKPLFVDQSGNDASYEITISSSTHFVTSTRFVTFFCYLPITKDWSVQESPFSTPVNPMPFFFFFSPVIFHLLSEESLLGAEGQINSERKQSACGNCLIFKKSSMNHILSTFEDDKSCSTRLRAALAGLPTDIQGFHWLPEDWVMELSPRQPCCVIFRMSSANLLASTILLQVISLILVWGSQMLGSCLWLESRRLSTTKCKNEPFCQVWWS